MKMFVNRLYYKWIVCRQAESGTEGIMAGADYCYHYYQPAFLRRTVEIADNKNKTLYLG